MHWLYSIFEITYIDSDKYSHYMTIFIMTKMAWMDLIDAMVMMAALAVLGVMAISAVTSIICFIWYNGSNCF